MNIYNIEDKLYRKHFRVAIYGSARIKKDNPIFKEVYTLAKLIAAENIDIITGGVGIFLEFAYAWQLVQVESFKKGDYICLNFKKYKPNFEMKDLQ